MNKKIKIVGVTTNSEYNTTGSCLLFSKLSQEVEIVAEHENKYLIPFWTACEKAVSNKPIWGIITRFEAVNCINIPLSEKWNGYYNGNKEVAIEMVREVKGWEKAELWGDKYIVPMRVQYVDLIEDTNIEIAV